MEERYKGTREEPEGVYEGTREEFVKETVTNSEGWIMAELKILEARSWPR